METCQGLPQGQHEHQNGPVSCNLEAILQDRLARKKHIILHIQKHITELQGILSSLAISEDEDNGGSIIRALRTAWSPNLSYVCPTVIESKHQLSTLVSAEEPSHVIQDLIEALGTNQPYILTSRYHIPGNIFQVIGFFISAGLLRNYTRRDGGLKRVFEIFTRWLNEDSEAFEYDTITSFLPTRDLRGSLKALDEGTPRSFNNKFFKTEFFKARRNSI